MVGFRSLKCSNMVGFRALQCSNSATGSTSLSRANPAGRPCRACNILLLIDNSSQGFNQVRALLFNRSVARFSSFLKCVRYYRALNCSDMVVFRALKCSQYGRFQGPKMLKYGRFQGPTMLQYIQECLTIQGGGRHLGKAVNLFPDFLLFGREHLTFLKLKLRKF